MIYIYLLNMTKKFYMYWFILFILSIIFLIIGSLLSFNILFPIGIVILLLIIIIPLPLLIIQKYYQSAYNY